MKIIKNMGRMLNNEESNISIFLILQLEISMIILQVCQLLDTLRKII